MCEGFPDALDLRVVCVEADLGLAAALQRVGQEMKLTHKALEIIELGIANFRCEFVVS